MCIEFWWCWVHLFLIDSCVDYSTKAVLILAFVAPHFNELGFSSNFDLTLMSFCTQGFPGVAESTFSKSEGKLLLGVRFPSERLRVLAKVLFPALNQRMLRSPLSRREGVICWKMDSATSPLAPRRMTGVGSLLRRVKVLGIEKPTI